jgi:hypothetical protein
VQAVFDEQIFRRDKKKRCRNMQILQGVFSMDIQIFAVKNLIGLDSFRLTPTPQYSPTKDYIPKEDIVIYPLRIFYIAR